MASRKRSAASLPDGPSPSTPKKAPKSCDYPNELTVALTGARLGDVLIGCPGRKDADGVRLEVAEGVVHVRDVHDGKITRDELVEMYARDRLVSRAVAGTMVDGRPRRAGSQDNALPMGSGCPHRNGEHSPEGGCDCEPTARFVIQQPGVWAGFAEDAGRERELAELVRERRPASWRDVLQLMGRKTLLLRAVLFRVSAGPRVVDAPAPIGDGVGVQKASGVHHIRACFGGDATGTGTVTYEIPGTGASQPLLVTVDRGGDRPLPDHRYAEAVRDIITAALPGATDGEALLAHRSLRDKTAGELKSALQKTARFGCDDVAVLDGRGGGRVSSGAYAATAVVVLALGPGAFVPELQKFTRGPEAAFKRAAVTLVEDAWAGDPESVQRLLGLAYVCQRVPTYVPTPVTVRECARLVGEAAAGRRVIAWRGGGRAPSPAGVGLTAGRLPSPGGHFARSARLLDEIGSFAGDKEMMHAVASLEKRKGHVPIWEAPPPAAPRTMPEHHIYDQHVARGIGHVLDDSGLPRPLSTFRERFRCVFDEVTGTNPRLGTVRPEDRPDVVAIRRAQRVHMALLYSGSGRPPELLRPDARPVDLTVDGEEELSLRLDPGVLAAGVGPVPVEVKLGKRRKLALYVLLGTQLPEEETVMLRPGRDAVRHLYDWGDAKGGDEEEAARVEEERRLAREGARNRAGGLPVGSSLLGDCGGHRATFRDGAWHLNGEPWERVVREGLRRSVPVYAPPPWAGTGAPAVGPGLLRDEGALWEAIRARGRGVVRGAGDTVGALCAAAPVAVVARAYALMRQQYETVAMPTPALDGGGLGTDQLQAFEDDWLVWRLLVLLGRLVPGALVVSTPPRFRVVDAGLLQLLLGWVADVLNSAPGTVAATAAAAASATGSLCSVAETLSEQLGSQLRPHQTDAVNAMCARDERGVPGHFLVMETGMGKTLTALRFFSHQIAAMPAYRERADLWVWVTPPGKKLHSGKFTLIESLGKQLRKWGAPYVVVPPPKNGAKAAFRRGVVNIVAHDHLRKMLPDLLRVGPRSVVVFDEVDELYNATKRTSAALFLASACWRFVAMTATPMTKTVDRLATWLGLAQNYPVTSKNYLVAASEMVAAQITLGIERVRDERFVPQTDAARVAFAAYLRSGGRAWGELARAIQAETDGPLCDAAAELARNDRRSHRDGGVLLVADSSEHVGRLVQLLGQRGIVAAGAERLEDEEVAVVVVAKTNARGYNGAIRLGGMVRGVYAGNGAQRHQMEGRICRIGQRRDRLYYVTIIMENTMLHVLFDRQQSADAINMSLQQFAQKYQAEVLALDSK